MESFIQVRKGTTPRRMHADLEGLKDDELGRYGFTGRTTSLYRRHDPTAFRATGPLAPSVFLTAALTPTDLGDPDGEPLELYGNDDCRVSLSRRALPMPFYARNVDGDELWFVHRGTGRFETELGPLAYRPGHYVYLPKALTYRHVPDDGDNHLIVVETREELRAPEAGLLGRHHPFDSGLVDLPEPAQYDGPHRTRLTHERSYPGQHTWLDHDHDPCDVEGWRGDNLPFAFHISDYAVVTSADVHLPPTVHLFLQAQGVAIMHFLPRPAETRAGVERTPWYHRNVDYDEIAFFHDGSVYGIQMPPGLVSHAPQGVHHGAPERAREHARKHHDEYDRVDWTVISVDTRARMVPSAAVRAAAGGSNRRGHGVTATHAYKRIAYLVVFPDSSAYRDVYGGVGDIVACESYLLKRDLESDGVLVFMHPIGGGAYLPMMNALARTGHHVIYCNSRYRGADSALIMEKVVEDLGACVRDAKERLGYAKVVLAGWSGGGSLSAYYQQQAVRPTVTSPPAGGGPDLTTLGLIPTDGLMLLAAHVSRHETLTEWMDASILDETDPSVRDRSLDLYDPDGPQPPYPQAFLDTYRAAQIARNRRIPAWVQERLDALQAAGREHDELGFVVHGTMADPRWLDPTVDPSDRRPHWCYLGDPQVVSNGPVGLARSARCGRGCRSGPTTRRTATRRRPARTSPCPL